MGKSRVSEESDLKFEQHNSPDNKQNGESETKTDSSSWWQPWSYLALSVHGVLVSAGEWAWNKTQTTIGGALQSVQRFQSGTNINNSQDGRVQNRYMTALEKIVFVYERCKENVNLAVIQTKLRLQLAANDIEFRSENLKVDTKKKWSERFDDTIKRPLVNIGSKLTNAKAQTHNHMLRYKDSLAASVNDNLDSITLKAKEYEDTIETKFPNLSVKLARKNKSASTSQDYPIYGTARCPLGRVAEPAPFLRPRGPTPDSTDDDKSFVSPSR